MFKRAILKVSGEQLATEGSNFDEALTKRICLEVDKAIDQGCELSIVVGGGNIWRGRDARPEMNKARAHQIGIVSTIVNALYLAEELRIHTNREALVMTPFDLCAFTTRFEQQEALNAMATGRVPVFAGGSGHPFVSTDTLVAIRACELEVDAVLYGKTVPAVYDKDPRKHQGAKMFRSVSYARVIHDNLSVADMSALAITHEAGIPCAVFDLAIAESITKACQGLEALASIGGSFVSIDSPDEFY